MNIGIVKAKYNAGITDKMLESAEKKAEELDADFEVLEVPGAYDTPLGADRLARKESIDAVVVLGAIIKGDTDHDSIIGDTAAQKLSQISLDRDKPVMLGITGPGMTAEEAKERIVYAAQAVESAVEMVEELEEV
jgi:6,7-dimethyl-8-ribityllumazine synthase